MTRKDNVMAKIKVTMERGEIEKAIREWAEKHHGLSPKDIIISTRKEWRRNGTNEYQEDVVDVTFLA